MNLLYLSPEVWPFTRVGGLAEVSHDLPLALGARGHQVSVVTIKSRMSAASEDALEKTDISLEVPVSWRKHRAEVYRRRLGPGVDVYLIKHDRLFDREGLYGNAYGDYEDNCERFSFFSRACLELAQALGREVDVVHANDRTTALAPVLLKTLFSKTDMLAAAGSLMTVHNLARQGVYWHYDMPIIGLGWEYFTPEYLEFHGKINLLKGGLVFADLISTVSAGYAREILDPAHGHGLDGVLRHRQGRLASVLNGIDVSVWDPASNPDLIMNFDPANLAGKAACRRDLRDIFGLPMNSRRPLAAVIGRLESRKGLDLILEAMDRMVELGLDLVIMGYGGDHYHNRLRAAAKAHPEHVGLRIGHDMGLDHKLMAGADVLLMPSEFEPCGLHQMHAMRYGTVPVVRATGGLDDTVIDHHDQQSGVGFKFDGFNSREMLTALSRAIEVFARPEQWQGLIQRCMALDFSWQGAAAQYELLYQRARDLRQEETA